MAGRTDGLANRPIHIDSWTDILLKDILLVTKVAAVVFDIAIATLLLFCCCCCYFTQISVFNKNSEWLSHILMVCYLNIYVYISVFGFSVLGVLLRSFLCVKQTFFGKQWKLKTVGSHRRHIMHGNNFEPKFVELFKVKHP